MKSDARHLRGALILFFIVHKLGAWPKDAGHAVNACAQRRLHKMRVTLRGLHLAVTQKAPDDFKGCAAADQQGGEGVAQIVDADIW